MARPRTKTRKVAPIADNIVRLRRQHGWTQAELARRLRTHLSNVARVEIGAYKPSQDMIEALMRAFGVSADELILEERKRTESELTIEAITRILARLTPDQLASVTTLTGALVGGLSVSVLVEQRERPRRLHVHRQSS